MKPTNVREVERTEYVAGDIGDLYPTSKTPVKPMYSFSRPAYSFWQGFYDALRSRGLTQDEAFEEMQSKGVRWLLDSHGTELRNLGVELGLKYELFVKIQQ